MWCRLYPRRNITVVRDWRCAECAQGIVEDYCGKKYNEDRNEAKKKKKERKGIEGKSLNGWRQEKKTDKKSS